MRSVIVALGILLMVGGCVYSGTSYGTDDAGHPVVTVENWNLLRVGTTAQIVTYDPKTKNISLTQVLDAKEMSGNLGWSWSRLLEVAEYALGGATISAAAGGPTTPAAVAGGLIGMLKQRLTDEERSEQDETQATSDDEPSDCEVPE